MSLTVSVISTPNLFEPVEVGNYGLWFQTSSTASNYLNFKYIYNLQSIDFLTSSITTNLGKYKVPPRPDGTGLFTPHKALKTKLSFDIDPFIQDFMVATNSQVQYNIGIGMEFGPSYSFTNTFNYYGLLGLSMSVPYDIQTGDTILISKNNTSINPQYNGYTTVFSAAPGDTLIVTNELYVTASVAESGLITDIQRTIGTTSNYYCFNGTKQYDQVNLNFGDGTHLITSSNSTSVNTNLLMGNGMQYNSNLNNKGKGVYINNYETISFLFDYSFAPDDEFIRTQYVLTYNDGTSNTYYLNYNASTNYVRVDCPTGPANMLEMGFNVSNLNYYSVNLQNYKYLTSSVIVTTAATMKYTITTSCSPYNNFRIAWVNQLGGIDYWNFNWKNVNTTNISKTTYNKQLPFKYSIGARGLSTLSTKATDTYYISSYWLQDYEAVFLKELLLSREVYSVDEVNNVYYPINILDSSYVVKTKLNDKLYSLSINFQYSYDITTYNQ